MKLRYLAAFTLMFSQTFLLAQDSTRSLELSKIMGGSEFIGDLPGNPIWSPDNEHFYFPWGSDDYDESIWFEYDLNSKKHRKLNSYECTQIPKSELLTDINKQHYYFKNKNDILKIKDNKPIKIFSFYSRYSIEKIMQDGSILLFISGQIVKFNPTDGTFIQLVKMVDPSKEKKEGFLQDQQGELFDVIKKRRDKTVEREGSRLPELFKENNITWFEVDDNYGSILYQDSDYPNNQNTEYAVYVTDDGYSQTKKARSKVGRPDPKHTLHMIDFNSNMQYNIDISGLTGIKEAPDYFKYYPENKAPEMKSVIYHNHGSSPDGKLFLIEIKSYDNKDRWICTVDHQAKLVEIDHQKDTAWIGGPGIVGWTSVKGNVGWLNNESIYFQSEESGYSHLYTYNLNKKKKTQLTEGNYEVHEVVLSKTRDKFYITANHNHPGNREFYSLDIKSKKLTGILTLAGNHEVSISPDEKNLAIRYSYINKPWEIYTAPLSPNTEKEQITESLTKDFEEYSWRQPAVINFEASDGKNLYARMYFPDSDMKNGAGIIFVHGAGYLQNAHNWWSGYYREYMFHNLLADLGYTVMDIDYRASKGYGRDHRVAIYRHMGGMDLSDQIDGRQFLIDTYKLDPDRIGIYGGSYGGFITLMALLKHPGKFKCGAALRSVTDWAHYNHPYTSNILNTPEKDPTAFKISSPIYFAENLEDRLIMLHGMEDDNVQYQDVVRLSQRFIELGKNKWDLIGYPIEPHSFVETTSWTDEYRRILELFQSELIDPE